jgi:hypothetical protein
MHLLILFKIGRLNDSMINQIYFAGLDFVFISFIFQFAYIWLLGSRIYRHFYDITKNKISHLYFINIELF